MVFRTISSVAAQSTTALAALADTALTASFETVLSVGFTPATRLAETAVVSYVFNHEGRLAGLMELAGFICNIQQTPV